MVQRLAILFGQIDDAHTPGSPAHAFNQVYQRLLASPATEYGARFPQRNESIGAPIFVRKDRSLSNEQSGRQIQKHQQHGESASAGARNVERETEKLKRDLASVQAKIDSVKQGGQRQVLSQPSVRYVDRRTDELPPTTAKQRSSKQNHSLKPVCLD